MIFITYTVEMPEALSLSKVSLLKSNTSTNIFTISDKIKLFSIKVAVHVLHDTDLAAAATAIAFRF